MSSDSGANEGDFIYDCILVGSGHAGSCTALSAVEHGCRPERVLIIEKAPEEWVGGNGCVLLLVYALLPSIQHTPLVPIECVEKIPTMLMHCRRDADTSQREPTGPYTLGSQTSSP